MNKKSHRNREVAVLLVCSSRSKNITKLESTHELAQRFTSGQWLQDLKAKAASLRASLEAAHDDLKHQPPPLEQQQQEPSTPPITQDL